MTKLSPAFTEGTSPNDPTNAAAPSLNEYQIARSVKCEETYEMMSP